MAQRLVARARRRAGRLGLVCTLHWRDILPALKAGVCEVTGTPFRHGKTQYRSNPFTPSLDRIDSRVGYHASNVQVVVWAFNVAKNEWDIDVFHQVARGYALFAMQRRSSCGAG